MKTLLLMILLFGAATNGISQYALDWFTLDHGGGRSSGGAYTISGTIGQPDAFASSGGSYTLHGGFWSAAAVVQTESAPSLRIIHSGTNVTLFWPNPSTGFQLEESPSLSLPAWADVSATPGVVGDEKQVNQTLAPGPRFYRLRKP